MPAHCIVPRIKMTEMFMAVMFFFHIFPLNFFPLCIQCIDFSSFVIWKCGFFENRFEEEKKNPSNMIEINALHRFVTDELRCAHNSVIQISVSKTKSAWMWYSVLMGPLKFVAATKPRFSIHWLVFYRPFGMVLFSISIERARCQHRWQIVREQ